MGIIVKKTKDKTIASPHIVINYVYAGDVFKYTGDWISKRSFPMGS